MKTNFVSDSKNMATPVKLSAFIRKSILWERFIKLSIFTIPMIWVTTVGYRIREKRGF